MADQSRQQRTEDTAPRTRYRAGDIVLYRDAEKFWTGRSGHTTVCKVERSWTNVNSGARMYDLIDVTTKHHLTGHPDYMRLLPPVDAMHDIDTAPLSEPDVGAMSAAAVAWLRQALRTDTGQPKVPAAD
ncbi:hypothetical protein [Actinacidiphila paucisporea]|uniref:Uncharacterized protein n=1 Tax=Actinacidiphila paucisporea TaxID=310782 RepID=A0A1M7QSW6_9ACTN|nr:hypothetical protein [Actinacidiphila paucisporea]SHN34643.1 hypothetical protein SAMN05216499_14142 [Actinacidiphila paucisporea]